MRRPKGKGESRRSAATSWLLLPIDMESLGQAARYSSKLVGAGALEFSDQADAGIPAKVRVLEGGLQLRCELFMIRPRVSAQIPSICPGQETVS
ncbi:hypothetical protein CQ010_14925 [Arthrobacter sp. MYb211]|nr:hypothetical protein CIK74_03275 [Glutamicibacter sp. BW77]PRA10283.1 hypothetical protein CQ015_14920 [Arthrobacter sp. MYb221]PRC05663.1 hypothetical protein CQ010_14925 [Arthrobacter sp. MYb211]